MNPFEKIKALLQSDDIMNVNMGIELLDTLATEPEELSQALGIDANISSVDDLKAALKGFEHQGTILVWVLGKWAELGVEWVLEIEKLNLSSAKMTELHPNIGLLTNLTTLYLGVNPDLDFEEAFEKLAQLPNLTTLYLRSNNIPGEEQAKIRTLLPKCRISF